MGDSNTQDLLWVRELLDEALLGVRSIETPEIPVEEARGYLSLALSNVYDACRDGVDYPTSTAKRQRAVEFARAALEALQRAPVDELAVDRELRLLGQALTALRDPDVRAPVAGLEIPFGRQRPPLLASTDRPRLHDLARHPIFPTVPLRDRDAVLMPDVDLDPLVEIPAIETMEQLLAWASTVEESAAALPPPPEKSDPPPVDEDNIATAEAELIGVAVPEVALVFERARVHFEEIGMFSLLRRGDAGDIWYQLEPVERRMLARVDSILSFGTDVVPRLIQLLDDRPLPDPDLLWAAIFLLGCIHGDDTRDQIVRLVAIAALQEPDQFEAVADALSHAPHTGITSEALGWLESSDPHRVALAAAVLGRKRATTVERLLPLLRHDHSRVLEETVRALERVTGELREDDIREALRHGDPAVFRAAVETSIVRGFRGAVIEAEYRLRKVADFPFAALAVAIASDDKALEMLFSAAASSPSPMVYEALGWLGQTSIVPFLIGRLRDGETAAVPPLQRLLGATLTEEHTYRTYEPERRPFVRETFLAPPFELVLSEDPDLWEHHWQTYGAEARDDRRYRFGHEWSTRDNYWELAEAYAAGRDRRLAYLELCARCGMRLGLDVDGWVSTQRPQIDAIRAFLGPEHSRAPRGLWTSRLLR